MWRDGNEQWKGNGVVKREKCGELSKGENGKKRRKTEEISEKGKGTRRVHLNKGINKSLQGERMGKRRRRNMKTRRSKKRGWRKRRRKKKEGEGVRGETGYRISKEAIELNGEFFYGARRQQKGFIDL